MPADRRTVPDSYRSGESVRSPASPISPDTTVPGTLTAVPKADQPSTAPSGRPPPAVAPSAARDQAPRPEEVPPVPLAELAKGLTDQRPLPGDGPWLEDVAIRGVTHDSRDVRPGDVYVALPGARFHGADFTSQVVAAGAVALFTDPDGAERAREAFAQDTAEVPILVVPDPRARMGALAARVYGSPADAMTLVGVTGTNGKTTTSFLIEGALAVADAPHASPGAPDRTPADAPADSAPVDGVRTGLVGGVEIRVGGERLPSERTTPEATQLHALFGVMRHRGAEAVAMEVSSHALVFGRVDGAVFDVAVFTNLTPEHLDFHTDMEDYFQAKAKLFTPAHSRLGVVNVDDAYGQRLAEEAEVPIVTYSARGEDTADWRAVNVRLGPLGSTFRVLGPDGAGIDARVRLPGPFNVANALAALVAAVSAGRTLRQAAAGVEAVPGVPGRMERVDAGQDYLAVVDYAHKPDALEEVLASLREVTTGQVHVVVGAGGDRDQYKRPHMGAAAAREADTVILTSDNPRTEDALAILVQLLEGAARVPERQRADVLVLADRRVAIRTAVRHAAPGDTVVVAGKGHEVGQYVGEQIRPFDDRAVLRDEIIAQLSGGTVEDTHAGEEQS